LRNLLLTLGLGVIAWAVPMLAAIAAYPLRESARPLFESIMTVAVVIAAATVGLLYFVRVRGASGRDGLRLGGCAVIVCVLIDSALMLPGGPLQMSFGQYLADIGATYLGMPVITWAMGAVSARRHAAP